MRQRPGRGKGDGRPAFLGYTLPPMIDLRPIRGSRAARRLARLTAIAGLLLLPACAAPTTPPDIVLVTLDCVRADRLSAYGGSPDVAPNLDRLAEQGTVFEHAHTAIGTTFPSHTTMLTGLYPRYHGVRRNGHRLPDEATTVAELLSAIGYHTASFVAYGQMHYLGNLKQGFDAVSDPERPPGRQGKRDGAETVRMAIDWLRGQPPRSDEGGAPIFLWVHLFDAHGPYELTPYSRERLEGYEGLLADGASIGELRHRTRQILATPESRHALEVLYDGEVHKLDGHVGELVEAVRSIGRERDTVWIVAADHGQGLGENGHMGHGPVLWEEVLRVPFVIADMRRPTAARVATTVGLVDVMPTILDLAGFEKLPPVQGRSLAPALESGELAPATYFAEVKIEDHPPQGRRHEHLAVYDGGLKLELDSARRNRLYELVEEPPGERQVQPEEHQEAMRRMLAIADTFLSQEAISHEAELVSDDIETLRALGYVE